MDGEMIFSRVYRLGRLADVGVVFVKAEITAPGNLSMTGVVEPPRNGHAKGGCGQICIEFKEYDQRGFYTLKDLQPFPDWSRKRIKTLFDLWNRWHLNDMRAGCEHQRASWDFSKTITTYDFSCTSKFYRLQSAWDKEDLTKEIYQEVHELCHGTKRPQYATPRIKELISLGWIEEHAKEKTESVGWVDYRRHPEGLLSKPCEVCGYAYGSSWLREELPPDVLETLRSLPETTIQPAWI